MTREVSRDIPLSLTHVARSLAAAWAPKFVYNLVMRRYPPKSGYEERIYRKYLSVFQKNSISIKDCVLLDIGNGKLTQHAKLILSSGARLVLLCEPEQHRGRQTAFEQTEIKSLLGQRPMLPSGVYQITNSMENMCDIPSNSIDIITSHAVLEHIKDIGRGIAECRRVLRPGGHMLHFIDLRDHRDFKKPFTFLRYRKFVWETFLTSSRSYTNRLRHSDFLRSFKSEGFQAIKLVAKSQDLSDSEYLNLRFSRDFSNYEKSDIQVIWMCILLRKNS